MNKFNKVLNVIFIVWIAVSTFAFSICIVVFEPGELLGKLFEIYVLALLCAIVGLMLTPDDL